MQYDKLYYHALAFVHDDCMNGEGFDGIVKYAIEFDNDNIIYHDVENLESL